MEITLVIDAFSKVLKDYEKAYKNNLDIQEYICLHAKEKYNVILHSLFFPNGYYKNYVNTIALNIPKNIISDNDILKFKISFLKTEIKELTKLQKQGYTHI